MQLLMRVGMLQIQNLKPEIFIKGTVDGYCHHKNEGLTRKAPGA